METGHGRWRSAKAREREMATLAHASRCVCVFRRIYQTQTGLLIRVIDKADANGRISAVDDRQTQIGIPCMVHPGHTGGAVDRETVDQSRCSSSVPLDSPLAHQTENQHLSYEKAPSTQQSRCRPGVVIVTPNTSGARTQSLMPTIPLTRQTNPLPPFDLVDPSVYFYAP